MDYYRSDLFCQNILTTNQLGIAFLIKTPKNLNMRVLFLIIILAFNGATHCAEVNSINDTTLVVCDIESSLFYPPNGKDITAIIYSNELLKTLQQHRKNGDKILYIAERAIPFIFWHKALGSSGIVLDNSLSLNNEIFMGFQGSQPSCQKGIILCQGHSFGAVFSVVLNQLWIRAQLQPKVIIYYTSNQNHANQLKVIAERIGIKFTIKIVDGSAVNARNIKQKLPTITTGKQISVNKTENRKTSELTAKKPEKIIPTKPKANKKIVIDKSKLVGV